MAMTIRGIACAALLAVVASPSRARAWGPTTPVGTPPATEAEAPEQPQPPDGAATPPAPPVPPEAPAAVAPPPETPPPAALPPPPSPPPPPLGEPILAGAPPVVTTEPASAPVSRPRLSAAVGFGGTLDSVGFKDGNTHLIPAFFTVLGIGDGLLFGVDLGAFASQAAGRHLNDTPVDRLGLDAFGVLRPGALYLPDDHSYQMRVLHAMALELGLGLERDGRSAISGTRFLLHTGARVDLPLSPASEPTDLRLRLAVRRGFGLYTPELYNAQAGTAMGVGDSAAELYAALVTVF